MKYLGCILRAVTAWIPLCATTLIAHAQSSSVTVETTHGPVAGLRQPGNVTVFKGIRYAQAPVGDLRWRPPLAPSAWTELLSAQDFAPDCIQPALPAGNVYLDEPARMSEDCLFVNVWKPAQARKSPVLVWIHGGALRYGNLSSRLSDGSQLARKGVVVVTLGYRLGALGYLAHPELTAESPHRSSGNYGLLDQIAALRWVHDNIARFGGDPRNVTVAGQSAGALSTIELMTSPLARGLFHRAIVQSGYMVSNMELQRPSFGQPSAEAIGAYVGTRLGAPNLAALRSMDAMKLVTDSYAAGYDPQATIDGWVLPRQIVDSFDRGEQARVPLIAGFNAGEVRSLRFFLPKLPRDPAEYDATVHRLYGDLATTYLKFYPAADIEESALAAARDGFYGWSAQRLVRRQTQLGVPAYLYFFEHRYPAEIARHLEAFHASELPYEFGLIASADRLPQNWPRPPDNAAERALSAALMSYFTSFVRSGKPDAPGAPPWRPFAQGAAFMDFREKPYSSSHILPGRYALQEEVVARRRASGQQNWYANVGLASSVVPAPAAAAAVP